MRAAAWQLLQENAADRKLLSGMTFETTLLGRVAAIRYLDDEWHTVIPLRLQLEAKKHGFIVESADHTRNAYTLRLL